MLQKYFVRLFALCFAAITTNVANADIILGPFDFNSAQFGNSLLQSDGGTHAATNWLNTSNVNPGSPGFLTGPNFNTGIANIGISGSVTYEIGYSTPIFNGTGDDLGVIVARFSSDPLLLSFSSDGINYSAPILISAAGAVATGVSMDYFYGTGGVSGSGPFSAALFVQPVDLSTFGFAPGASIIGARVESSTELDLVRIAGFDNTSPVNPVVPAPSALLIGSLGGVALAGLGRLRRRKSNFPD